MRVQLLYMHMHVRGPGDDGPGVEVTFLSCKLHSALLISHLLASTYTYVLISCTLYQRPDVDTTGFFEVNEEARLKTCMGTIVRTGEY